VGGGVGVEDDEEVATELVVVAVIRRAGGPVAVAPFPMRLEESVAVG